MNRIRRIFRRRLARGFRSTGRMLIFACALMSLWRAPLPWLHRHSDADDVFANASVARHVEAWHTADHTEETGWHLHFATIADILRGAGCPIPPSENEEDPPVVLAKHVVAVDCSSAERLPLAPRELIVSEVEVASQAAESSLLAARPRYFLLDFTLSGRLQPLLSVARC